MRIYGPTPPHNVAPGEVLCAHYPLLRTVVAAALVSVALAGRASALEVGQKAPDFALNGVDGKPVKLSDLTAKGPVVIYTFIAAFTPT